MLLDALTTDEQLDPAAPLAMLLEHFDLIVQTPADVDKLDAAILQLAVEGKLVAQDPDDKPASELVQWVRSEKLRLHKAGVIAEIEQGKKVQPSEAQFPLPLGWMWQRLVDVSLVEMGQSPPGDSYNEVGEGVPLVNGPVEFSPGPFGLTTKTKFTTKPTKMCQEGDLLVCVRGSTTGRTNIAAFDACIGRGVAAVRSLVDRQFLNYVILSKRQEIYDAGKGSTFPSISKKQLQDIVIGVPPLAEQKRIVAKVDELLALCDVLEAELAEAEAVRVRLVDAILAGV